MLNQPKTLAMKTNLYDWPDEYDRVVDALCQFIMEHLSIKNLVDAGLPMEVHQIRLVKDLKKKYDMTKSYQINKSYNSLRRKSDNLQTMVIIENFNKMQNGTLHRWSSSSGDEKYDDSLSIGSDTYRRIFDMGIIINTQNFDRIKANLKQNVLTDSREYV